jgi:hemerythrin
MEDIVIDEAILNELNLGISELDDQNQAFLMHVVGLRKALTEGFGGRDKLMKTLRFLDTFIDDRFQAEENSMRRHHYPGILVHRADHDVFAKNVADFKKKALDYEQRGEVVTFLAVEVTHLLERWLTEHIRVHDRKMADYLAEHG